MKNNSPVHAKGLLDQLAEEQEKFFMRRRKTNDAKSKNHRETWQLILMIRPWYLAPNKPTDKTQSRHASLRQKEQKNRIVSGKKM